jgi:hypothetical protein
MRDVWRPFHAEESMAATPLGGSAGRPDGFKLVQSQYRAR